MTKVSFFWPTSFKQHVHFALNQFVRFFYSLNTKVTILFFAQNPWSTCVWWFLSGLFLSWSYPTQPPRKLPDICIIVKIMSVILDLTFLSRLAKRIVLSIFLPVEYLLMLVIEINYEILRIFLLFFSVFFA